MTSPKARFLQDKNLSRRHSDYTASSAFLIAAEAALAEMFANMTATTDMNQSMMAHQRMLGARTFIDTFASLGLPAKDVKPSPIPSNLNHEAH